MNDSFQTTKQSFEITEKLVEKDGTTKTTDVGNIGTEKNHIKVVIWCLAIVVILVLIGISIELRLVETKSNSTFHSFS